jgi:hypothetical protein
MTKDTQVFQQATQVSSHLNWTLVQRGYADGFIVAYPARSILPEKAGGFQLVFQSEQNHEGACRKMSGLSGQQYQKGPVYVECV